MVIPVFTGKYAIHFQAKKEQGAYKFVVCFYDVDNRVRDL